jgi:hypothetical protein
VISATSVMSFFGSCSTEACSHSSSQRALSFMAGFISHAIAAGWYRIEQLVTGNPMLSQSLDEGRKRVIGIIAGILMAHHMPVADDLFGGPQGSPRTDKMIAASVQWAELIMQKIDAIHEAQSHIAVQIRRALDSPLLKTWSIARPFRLLTKQDGTHKIGGVPWLHSMPETGPVAAA